MMTKCDDCLFCSGIKWIGGYPQVKCEQPYMRGKHPDADVGCEWRVQKKEITTIKIISKETYLSRGDVFNDKNIL